MSAPPHRLGAVFELHHLSAQELWDWIRRGEATALEVTEHYLARIERLDPGLGAFVTVTADAARDRADRLGHLVPTSRPLWGLPSADKDLYDRAGVPTRSGTASLPERPAAADHPLVAALDAAGTVSLGKTASPEFGMSSSSETRLRRDAEPVRHARARRAGRRAVRPSPSPPDSLPAAVGSDGGGSVRIPAAATGLVGLKPSRGRVPSMPGRSGVGGLSVAGPLTRSVADAGMLLDALVAPTGLPEPSPYALVTPDVGEGPFTAAAVRGEGRFVVGLLDGSPWDDTVDVVVDPAARAAVETAVRVLGEVGHGVEDVPMPRVPYADAVPGGVGELGGAAAAGPGHRPVALTPLVAWLVARGRSLTGTQVLDAMSALDTFSATLIGAFDRFDAVLTPTLAMTPRPLGWYGDDPDEDFRRQCAYSPWTSMANVAGLPAITLPVGVTADDHPDAGVNQSQVKPAIGLTFAAALRSFVRQDPDVIMVGEVRDAETAHVAVHAALTGHLVLTTLHTETAAAAVPRLLDLGVEDFLLRSTLRAWSRSGWCASCASAASRRGRWQPTTSTPIRATPRWASSGRDHSRTVGCESCGGAGYRGRLGVSKSWTEPRGAGAHHGEPTELLSTRWDPEDDDDARRRRGQVPGRSDLGRRSPPRYDDTVTPWATFAIAP